MVRHTIPLTERQLALVQQYEIKLRSAQACFSAALSAVLAGQGLAPETCAYVGCMGTPPCLVVEAPPPVEDSPPPQTPEPVAE